MSYPKLHMHLTTLEIQDETQLSWALTSKYADIAEQVVLKGNVKCNNMSNLFANFSKLKTIEGSLDTSDCKDFSYAYANCRCLTQPIKDLDTSNGEEFDFMHSNNSSLESAKFNSTLKGVKFNNMFFGCSSIKSIKGVNVSNNVTKENMEDILTGCHLLDI